MGILEEFEQEFGILTAEITSQIGKINLIDDSLDHNVNKKALLGDIKALFEDGDELLEQINLEIGGSTEKRLSHQTRLKAYVSELSRLKEEFNKTKNKKYDLTAKQFDESEEDEFDIRSEQKQRLLDNSSTLEKTGRNLVDGYRIAIETEEISNHILSNLSQQRETIKTSRNRLRETNAELGRSSRLINTMMLRNIRDKFLLYIIAFILIFGIFVTIYFSFK